MERYERLVFRIGYAYSSRTEDALDISQNVFLKVHHNLDSFKGKGSFRAWLLRIAHNESANWIRMHKYHRKIDELTPTNAPRLGPVQDDEVLRHEYQELLRDEMEHLNDRQRQAVTLRYFEDMSLREIAGVLECSEGVVKNILFRSLEKLRNRLTTTRRGNHEGL
jgi:RNA polymerase sigma-70 factor (ECF subfamily)